MAEDTSKVIIIALITLIILAGGFLIFQKFSSKTPSQTVKQDQPIQIIQNKNEIAKETTPSAKVKVLPKTGGEVYFLSLLGISFLVSGWSLSKFPK